MSYTALYRKKRPKTFGEVVGQPAVVRALSNQLAAGQISHAYLFCGSHGTGKTSIARIFARAVNCINPKNGEPCNECESCVSILAERNMCVSETDAASNNGVDNIRDLREEVKYPPTEGRRKVYIIDEVHMLSTGAFNALLKTLEEPPEYAMFLLATTDPQKVPATILSRCQRYDFKRISSNDITSALRGYLDADGIRNVDGEALEVIASHSDGAMRDALSLLDQALSLYAGESVGRAKIYEMLGAADKRVLDDFAVSLAVSDAARLFEIIDGASRDGRDMVQFAVDLIQHFRDLYAAGELSGDKHAGKVRPEQLTHWLVVMSEALRDMKYAPNPRTALEVVTLRLCSGGGGKDETREALLARIARLEERLEYLEENGVTVSTAGKESAAEPATPEPPIEVSETKPEPDGPYALDPALFEKVKNGWQSFCGEFPPLMRSMLSSCSVSREGGLLVISSGVEASADYLKSRKKILTEKLTMMYSLPESLNLAFKTDGVYNNVAKTKQPESNARSASPVANPLPAKTAGVNPFDGSPGGNPLDGNPLDGNPLDGNPLDENPPVWGDDPGFPSVSDDDWGAFGQQVDMNESDGVW